MLHLEVSGAVRHIYIYIYIYIYVIKRLKVKGKRKISWLSCFRHEVDGNCALLGHYAASGGNFLSTFRYNLSVPSSGFKNPKRNPEDGTASSSQNVGKKLPLLAA